MKSRLTAGPVEAVRAPLVAVAVADLGEGGLPGSLTALDQACGGALTRAVAAGDFTGKRDEVLTVYPSEPGAQRVVLIGLGDSIEMNRGAARRAAAIAARRAAAAGAPSLAVAIATESRGGVAPEVLAQVLVEGAAQGAWVFRELRARDAKDRTAAPTEVQVVIDGAESSLERGLEVGQAIAAGHAFARDLQMQPGNICTPAFLAEGARALGTKHRFDVTVLDKKALEQEGLRSLIAVGQGSAQEPKLIELAYRGAGDARPVVLIGKGITFDSGGISIKPALNMEEMKFDMSGAAAVLGTFEALGRLRPAINVIGLVPTAENMPSSTAVKPGDVIRSHLGKTIEVVNTDAEGRLVLVDALSFARRHKPACVLDAATLTGAVIIALGHSATALMGNDDSLVSSLREAGDRAGERCWPLPLWDEYRDLIKSDIADVKNTGGRPAGTITAAWFLREFVDGFPWAHLDIAGTAWTERDQPDYAKGPTGIGVRLFTEFLLHRAAAQ